MYVCRSATERLLPIYLFLSAFLVLSCSTETLPTDSLESASLTGGIFGLVTGDGAPVSGLTVILSRSGSEGATVVTDANGEFGFTDLDTGTYTVAIAEIAGMTCSSEQAAPVVAGKRTQVMFACVTPTLPVAVGSVAGRVTVNGVGARRVLVSLRDARGHVGSTTTGNDGFYRFMNVPTGAKSVWIITDEPCPGTKQENAQRELEVTVAQGGVAVADFACSGQVLTGSVTVDGFPVSGWTVYACYGLPVWDYGCALPSQLTDSGGQYSYTSLRRFGLLPGNYVVFVESPPNLTCPEPLTVPVGSGETRTVDLACVVKVELEPICNPNWYDDC